LASKASLNGMFVGNSFVSGIECWSGDDSLFGSDFSHCVRSLLGARSQMISDATEKFAGAGDDPNGSLVRSAPIS
jgi:hypothetical protein